MAGVEKLSFCLRSSVVGTQNAACQLFSEFFLLVIPPTQFDSEVASFKLLEEIAYAADVDNWNTVISGCTQNGYFWEAINAFNLMRLKSYIILDTVTLVSVVSACGNLELICEGKSIHALALKTSTGQDIRVQNALITMYGKLSDMESARSVFELCVYLNLCSWNCMISALAQNGSSKEAIEFFRACNYHGDLQLGKKVARILFSLEPENVGYHLALSNIYNATGSWKEAGELRDIVHIKGLKKSAAYSLIDVGSCTDAKKSAAYS
ncbi:hypothetical protein K7X08_029154 [Anisodus acutangulus]|uniref:Pentatricopeptide repeat-containing protein n=1 Tax=Anisodus acutangulus TaxID=402998 RepID=A0A9Q1L1S4_9SOLA|nr:hypothetical protein K7X08_029154 [Anisodus acutangulus]